MKTRWTSPSGVLVLVTALSAGCSVRPQWPEPEAAARIAVRAEAPIVFRGAGGESEGVDSGADGASLPLHEAIGRALTTNAEIQAALARVKAAYAEAHQARLLPNPVLSVALRFPEAGTQPTVEASLAADLLSLLRKPGQVRAADHRLRAAGAEAVAAVLDAVAEVEQQYAAVQAHDAMAPELDGQKRLLRRLRDLAVSRFEAGEGTRLDVTTLETQQAELDVEVASHGQERRDARLLLARLIGTPSSEARWLLDPWEIGPALPNQESEWIAAALKQRPEIQSRAWELAALGVEIDLTRWLLAEGGEAGVEAEHEEGEWSVGPAIAVPLPIFDWGQAKREIARAKQVEAMHHLLQSKRVVIEEVRRAFARYTASADTYRRIHNELLPLLERRRTGAEAAYRAGEADVVFLILTEQELQTSRARLFDLQRRTSQSLSQLRRAVGGVGHSPVISSAATQPNNQ